MLSLDAEGRTESRDRAAIPRMIPVARTCVKYQDVAFLAIRGMFAFRRFAGGF